MKSCYLKDPKIFYRKRIIPGKPCLLFFHGIFGTSSAWVPYEKELKNFSFISLDIRGHGKSFRPENMEDYSFSILADDVYSVIKKEKIKKLIVVGNSYGNFIAFEFMKKYPELVKGAIFISAYDNPSKIPLVKLTKPIVKLICNINLFFHGGFIGKHFDYYSIFKNRHTGDWDIRRLYPDIKNTGLKSGLCCFKNLYDYSAGNFLYDLKIPILIIHGNKDTIFPLKYVNKMVLKMKKTKLVIINTGDHIILLNHYRDVIKIMKNFLEKNIKK